jgi:hypothetical protein
MHLDWGSRLLGRPSERTPVLLLLVTACATRPTPCLREPAIQESASAPSAERAPLAPEDNDLALAVPQPLQRYEAFSDGRGNLFLLSAEGLATGMIPKQRAFFFGTRAALRAQSVFTWRAKDGDWTVEFLDAGVLAGTRATLARRGERTLLTCDQHSEELTALSAEDRERMLGEVRFFGARWAPFALGRTGRDTYLYIDYARDPEEHFRVFTSSGKALSARALFGGDEVIRHGDAVTFFVDGDILHAEPTSIAGDTDYLLTLKHAAGTVHYTPMSKWRNHRLINVEFAIYRPQPSPCRG